MSAVQATTTFDIVPVIIGLVILMFMFAMLGIFMRLGGWPEGYYRIMRIPRFVYFITDTDGTPIRTCIKGSKIVTQSPPKFTDKNGKVRYVDRANLTRSKGAPSHYYQPDNALPIPMMTGNRDVIIDPRRIDRAFRTEIVTRLFKIGQEKKSNIRWGRLAILAIGAIVFIIIAVAIFR